ncbi:MAG: GTPase [Eubacteriales bacterium]
MKEIPVYLFVGFLEGGKTKFIKDTIAEGQFDDGETTLLLICEEGIEEYDIHSLERKKVFAETISDVSELNSDNLASLLKKHKATRVLCEYNGMWQIQELFEALPDGWLIAQIMMFCDTETFLDYNANMRSLVVDKLNNTDLVVFNRFDASYDKMKYHSIVRGITRRADIAYEYPDGNAEYDDIADPLPYDIDAPIIEVADRDYAIWYRDISEEMEKYNGKTIRLKGLVARNRNIPNDSFVIGRDVMTCCEADIKYAGMLVEGVSGFSAKHGDWVMLTARINIKNSRVYGRRGPVLSALSVEKTQAPEQPVATFY